MKQKADLSGLTKAGRHFQTAPTVEKERLQKSVDDPVTETRTPSDFSHLGGKLVVRPEIPTGDVDPVDFSDLYGETGGLVLAPPSHTDAGIR